MIEEFLSNPISKAVFVVGLGSLLSVPVAALGDLISRLPTKWLAAGQMHNIMAFCGLIAGGFVAHWLDIPTDIGMEVGAIAGGFSAKAPRIPKLNGGSK